MSRVINKLSDFLQANSIQLMIECSNQNQTYRNINPRSLYERFLSLLFPFYRWKKNPNTVSIPFPRPITVNRKFLLTGRKVREIRWLWPESFHVLSIIMKYNATVIMYYLLFVVNIKNRYKIRSQSNSLGLLLWSQHAQDQSINMDRQICPITFGILIIFSQNWFHIIKFALIECIKHNNSLFSFSLMK